MTVSVRTSCNELFEPLDDSVMTDALDLVEKKSYGLSDEGRARRVADLLQDIAYRAEPRLQPFIDTTSQTMRQLEEAIAALDEDSSINVAEFKAAALELIGICEKHLD